MYAWGIDIKLQENYDDVMKPEFSELLKSMEGMLGIASYGLSFAVMFNTEFARDKAFISFVEKGYDVKRIKQAGNVDLKQQFLSDIKGEVFTHSKPVVAKL